VRVTARYRAPAGDGGLLAQPPLNELGSQLDANADRLNTLNVRLGGIPLAEFRSVAATEILEAASQYLAEPEAKTRTAVTLASASGSAAPDRLIVAGHQPEFFHPGVWVKNFVLAAQAKRHGRAALNLVVDNDTTKGTALRVPVVADDPTAVTVETIPFDRDEADLPYEECHVADRGLFDSFPNRLGALTRSWGFEPLALPTWLTLRALVDDRAPLGEAVARVRRGWEQMWGVTNFELPVSRLAGTRAFAGFVQTVLADLPRFADDYNGAIRAYRKANHLRGRNHPAPELARRGDAVEAPFWVWRADAPRRVKLFACRTESGIELRAGERSLRRVPVGTDAFYSAWAGLLAAGWKVRPRALTLTLFTRLGFADGFMHGIGGGKYDEVTDDIIRRYFHIDPPGYAVVSATVRLPIRRFPATAEALRRAERLVRDLDWNPQRFSEANQRSPQLVVEKFRLIEAEPVGHADRRAWFRELQRVTRDLRLAVADRRESAMGDTDRLRAELGANDILASREYAWPLFPESFLRNSLSQYQ
jgi:hypothetical protein